MDFFMNDIDLRLLTSQARSIRQSVLTSLHAAGSGHLGGSLGLADIFTLLYSRVLNHDPSHPNWPERDRLILSIGHVAPVLYASLAHFGYFHPDELLSLRKLGSRLQGHPGRDHGLPGIELSAGSLGQGLSVAVGMALSAKYIKSPRKIYCIMGDGELQEGSIWEAAMSASHHSLSNLIAIVDRNHVQIDGNTSQVMEIEPLADKWAAFGWNVLTCDGHNFEDLEKTFNQAKNHTLRPSVILANTLMGKGVPEIEGNYRWHGKAPNDEELSRFLCTLS
jgi:transketolase